MLLVCSVMEIVVNLCDCFRAHVTAVYPRQAICTVHPDAIKCSSQRKVN